MTVPIPFTVVGGFLGSGKTTLVNHLLRHAGGERITVLVNDFGDVAIDADLIEAHDGDTITLANGCICCSIGGELAGAIPTVLAARPRPDRILVEASGIAEPRRIAAYGTLPGLRPDGTLVLADAETVVARCADDRIGHQVRAQLAQADLIVLTKVDLLDDDEVAARRAWLAATFPGIGVVEARAGVVAPEALLGSGVGLDGSGPGAVPGDAPGDGAPHGFATCTFEAHDPIPRDELEAWLGALPPAVLRAKGLVRTVEASEVATIVQRVGARTRLTAGGPWTDPAVPGRIVLIAAEGELGEVTAPAPWHRRELR